MKRLFLFLSLLTALLVTPALSKEEQHVAILGDSIPYAGGWPTLVTEALHQNKNLSDALIANICVPSETVSGLSEEGHAGGAFPRPSLHDRLARVLAQFKPNLIVACYGINDGIYLPLDKKRFEAYQNGCERLKNEAEAAGARIIFATPPPYRADNGPQKQDEYDKVLDTYGAWLMSQRKKGWEVIDIRPYVKKAIAKEKKATPGFTYAGDGVHPGPQGHQFIAEAICKGLVNYKLIPSNFTLPEGPALQEATGRQNALKNEWLSRTKHQRPEIAGYTPTIPRFKDEGTVVSSWNGYEKCDFQFEGRNASIVFPKKAATGNPWIWRPEFFGYEPKVDIALLGHGFAVAYVDMQNMYGSPAAMKVMDAFYKHLTENYELSRRPVIEGFSRGGLYTFNWTARHPKCVSAIYAEVPVCDIKSWPAGKGKGDGAKADWDRLLAIYGMTEQQAMSFKGNPVNNLKEIAAAKVPILCVIRTDDTVVPPAENTQVLAARYKKLGGSIEIISGPGNHQSPSLKDPSPIVNFILNATKYPNPTRIVCLGDSITFGFSVQPTERWSNLIAKKLGDEFNVINNGISGCTLLNHGDKPYTKESACTQALEAKADIALIALGTNDSKPQNWKFKKEFASDYKALIEALRKDNPKIQIYCLKAIPSLQGDDQISATRVAKEVNPLIERIAKQNKCKLIDLFTPMKSHTDFIADTVHPNPAGHAIMADVIYEAITSQKGK
ncbi:MAG: GDSL-type esterase/lipase family protein [Akkermansia sp.]